MTSPWKGAMRRYRLSPWRRWFRSGMLRMRRPWLPWRHAGVFYVLPHWCDDLEHWYIRHADQLTGKCTECHVKAPQHRFGCNTGRREWAENAKQQIPSGGEI